MLFRSVVYDVEVEAETDEDAAMKAEELWLRCPTPDATYNGRGLGVRVTDVTEVPDGKEPLSEE